PEPRVANAADIDPALLQRAARLALSSRHPLAVAVAKEAKGRVPLEGATEEPGQGVRAMIDGVEARLGSPAFCGIDKLHPFMPGASLIAFRHGDSQLVLLVRQTLRADADQTVAAL